MTGVGLCSTSDIITFDQSWHRFAGGKDLSYDTQIRVIGSMEPEICTEMLRNLCEKHRAKFPATTLSYSMVKIAHLDDAISEMFGLEASPVKGQSLPQKDKKRRKRKGGKKLKNPKSLKTCRSLCHPKTPNFDICTCPSKNTSKCSASGNKGMLSCCKCLFE